MSTVVPISSAADRAYQDYCDCARKAQATLERADMEAAGRAWRRWLDTFMTADQRAYLDKPTASVTRCR